MCRPRELALFAPKGSERLERGPARGAGKTWKGAVWSCAHSAGHPHGTESGETTTTTNDHNKCYLEPRGRSLAEANPYRFWRAPAFGMRCETAVRGCGGQTPARQLYGTLAEASLGWFGVGTEAVHKLLEPDTVTDRDHTPKTRTPPPSPSPTPTEELYGRSRAL